VGAIVGVLTWVELGKGVGTGVSVRVGAWVLVGVKVGVLAEVELGNGVRTGVKVRVGACVLVGVKVGVLTGVKRGVGDQTGVKVRVGACVLVGVKVAVLTGVKRGVGVRTGVNVWVGACVLVSETVTLDFNVPANAEAVPGRTVAVSGRVWLLRLVGAWDGVAIGVGEMEVLTRVDVEMGMDAGVADEVRVGAGMDRLASNGPW
jgi:hypothetical protein